MKQKSILDINISTFSNYKATEPKEINLLTWLNSKKYCIEVEKIRNTTDEAIKKILKSKLPAITPSGTFSKRCTKNLIKHSGFIQFDIDYKDNLHIKNYENLKNEISKLKEVAYCGLSVSGKGYWGLIAISNTKQHKEHFEALYLKFKKLGINIDKSCKDVSRLRGYSFDDNAYFNHSAPKFTQVLKPKTNTKTPRNNYKTNNSISVKNSVEKNLNIIQEKRIDIALSYEDWFSIGCSIANEFGESGREYFHTLSKMSDKYKHSDTEKQYNNCLKNKYGFSIATFFHYCKLHNV
jgi:hypothetical protein